MHGVISVELQPSSHVDVYVSIPCSDTIGFVSFMFIYFLCFLFPPFRPPFFLERRISPGENYTLLLYSVSPWWLFSTPRQPRLTKTKASGALMSDFTQIDLVGMWIRWRSCAYAGRNWKTWKESGAEDMSKG